MPRLWINGLRDRSDRGVSSSGRPGSIHIVSTWDEGVPDDIPHENLHGITFNGANILAWLTKVEGAATATTVATDGLMPSTLGLIRKAFPSAELVDGERADAPGPACQAAGRGRRDSPRGACGGGRALAARSRPSRPA